VNVGICLANNQGNFQLHRFTTSENIAKSFNGGLLFDSHYITVEITGPSRAVQSVDNDCDEIGSGGHVDRLQCPFIGSARAHLSNSPLC